MYHFTLVFLFWKREKGELLLLLLLLLFLTLVYQKSIIPYLCPALSYSTLRGVNMLQAIEGSARSGVQGVGVERRA